MGYFCLCLMFMFYIDFYSVVQRGRYNNVLTTRIKRRFLLEPRRKEKEKK